MATGNGFLKFYPGVPGNAIIGDGSAVTMQRSIDFHIEGGKRPDSAKFGLVATNAQGRLFEVGRVYENERNDGSGKFWTVQIGDPDLDDALSFTTNLEPDEQDVQGSLIHILRWNKSKAKAAA